MRPWLAAVRRAYGAAATAWLGTCLVLLAVNLLAWAFHSRADPARMAMLFDRRVLERVYPDLGADGRDLLMSESARELIYEPYTDHTLRPIRGRYVNVTVDGFRVSRNQGPWPPAARAYNVFVFGGSTLFGVGVRDEDTVASYLQALLEPIGGRQVRVYNFGRSGYYSSQERILVEKLLVAGIVPDAAVFLDGLNEFRSPDDLPVLAAQLSTCSELGGNRAWLAALRDLPLAQTAAHVGRLVSGDTGGRTRVPRPYDDAVAADTAIDRYLRNQRMLEALAAAHGFAAVFVWQPVPSYHYPPGEAGTLLMGGLKGYARFGYPRMVDRLAGEPLGPHFVWCADVGADADRFLYVDPVHYSPSMSERVARCMADALQGRRLLQPLQRSAAAAPASPVAGTLPKPVLASDARR